MKILVAVQSDDNAKVLGEKTLTWAPRAGYDFRIFIPTEDQLQSYQGAIDDANHNEYLDLHYGAIVVGQDPIVYAKTEGYDLLLLLPDDLRAWKRNNNRDKMIIDYAAEIGKCRLFMSLSTTLEDPPCQKIEIPNGAIMIRL